MAKLRLSNPEAEVIALKALTFLLSSGERASRFLKLTGLSPDDLRAGAGDRDFLAGVIDHLLADESMLIMFSQDNDIDPTLPAIAADLLRGLRDAG